MARTAELSPERTSRIQQMLRDIVRDDFANKQNEAADKIGAGRSQLSEFLSGSRGAGLDFIEKVADYTGRSIDELLGRSAGGPTGRANVALEGWKESEEIVRKQNPSLGLYLFERARKMMNLSPRVTVTPEYVLETVLYVMKTMPLEERAEEERKRVEAQVARINTSAGTRAKKKLSKEPPANDR